MKKITKYVVSGIVTGALALSIGCSTPPTGPSELEKTVGALSTEVATIKKNSRSEVSSSYKTIVGRNAPDTQTVPQLVDGIETAVKGEQDVKKAVFAYEAMKGVEGFDSNEAKEAINANFLMKKVNAEKDAKKVLAAVRDYADATGTKVKASEDGNVLYIKGDFGEFTVQKSGDKYSGSRGYHGSLDSITGDKATITEGNYQKLTGKSDSEKKIAESKGLDKLTAISDAVIKGHEEEDKLAEAVKGYLKTEDGKKVQLGVRVSFINDKDEFARNYDLTNPAEVAGIVGYQNFTKVLSGQPVDGTEDNLATLATQGYVKNTSVPALQQAIEKEDCSVKIYRQ